MKLILCIVLCVSSVIMEIVFGKPIADKSLKMGITLCGINLVPASVPDCV